jgi:hypothetical protein
MNANKDQTRSVIQAIAHDSRSFTFIRGYFFNTARALPAGY